MHGVSWKEMGGDIKIEARRWIARSLRAYGIHDYRADNRVADEKDKRETWGVVGGGSDGGEKKR